MASTNRTAQFAKIHKVLKKHYKAVVSDADRKVLEHVVFACCLEDARYEAAEEAFAGLIHTFYDWNEIRVTSVVELGETLSCLPDPRLAANRMKRVLQGIFEEAYSFDLEEKRKKNLGPTVKWLEKLDGTSPFVVSYVVQAALGGHSIPIGAGELQVMRIFDLVTDKDVENKVVPGLERAVAKSKGVEFASLLHQLAADFVANPFAPALRKILLEIDPGCKERLPKRRVAKSGRRRKSVKAESEPAEAKTPKGRKPETKATKGDGRKPAKKTTKAPAKSGTFATSKPAASKKKPVAKKTTAAKKTTKSKAAGKSSKKKSGTQRLAKRKPR